MIKIYILVLFLLSISFSQTLQGTEAPLFFAKNLNSPDKKFVQLKSEFDKGNGVVLSFFASWCAPCQQELPFLEKLHEEKGVSLMVVSVDDKFTEKEVALMAKIGVNSPVFHDTYKIISKQYGFTGALPYTVYIDSKGIIQEIKTGFSYEDTTEIRAIIEGL